MSLLHLPLYLLCGAIHRRPNDGSVSWASVQTWLQDCVEAAERQVWRTVHVGGHHSGSDRAELQRQLQLSTTSQGQRNTAPAAVPTGAMIFPFSPPVLVPCPYAAVVDQIAGVKGGKASSEEEGHRVSQGKDGDPSHDRCDTLENVQYGNERG